MTQQCNDDTTPCCSPLGALLSPDLFRALGDASRVDILTWLARCREPVTVGEIATCCPLDVSVVSRHLAVLRDAGIVETRKEGRKVLVRLRFEHLSGLLRQIADAIDACCPPGGGCAAQPPDGSGVPAKRDSGGDAPGTDVQEEGP